MDPITLAIIAGLAKVSEAAIMDGYNALKAVIAHKFGSDSDLAKAVENVEKKPDSAGRRDVLQEEVAAVKANQDPDLLKAAESLLAKIKEVPGGQTTIQQAVTGDKNIFSGSGNVTVTNQS
jgi:hypothetical protein